MKTKLRQSLLILSILFVAVSSSWLKQIPAESSLEQALDSNKKVWLVFSGPSNEPSLVAKKVAELFRGMFNVAYVKGEESSSGLKIYKDDRQNPIVYQEDVEDSDAVVKAVLSNVDELVEARSEVAKALKANQEFQEKEKQRAKKQWDAEQELRKKSDTIVLDINNWNLLANGREPWIVNFYEANNSACISLNKDWEHIATQFKGQAKIAKINITEPGNEVLEEQIQLQKYPSVRFYKSGPKKINEFEQFEGIHKRFSLQEWVNEKLSQKQSSVEIPRLNAQNYQTLCKSTKNTCVIIFMETEDSESLKKIEQLSVKYLKKPISFLISKKGEQDAFAGQVGVSSYPDTVMMYCKLKKSYRMQGLDFKAIDDAIGQISLGNRNGFARYNFAEEIK